MASSCPEELQAVNTSFATLVLDSSGRGVRANAKFLQSLGYTPDDVPGLTMAMLSPPLDGLPVTAVSEWQAVSAGQLRETERPRLRKDGSRRWIQAFYTPLKDPQGRVVQVVEISWDITERVMRSADDRGQVRAIHASQAVVQFALDGTILEANDIFLDVMGYRLPEIAGRHHRLFMAPGEADGAAYEAFWARLAAGQHHAGEYRRIGKDGREVWLQANYSPIFDPAGRPIKVVKYAADITRERTLLTDFQWQVTALNKSHGVITFDMQGVIIDANEHFLSAVGYRLDEIVGRHHRLFVELEVAVSPIYKAFWQTLGRGMHQAGEFRRLGKDGREIWLQASYNPIMDVSGRPIKVIKYATDITREKLRQADYESQITAIEKSQGVMTLSLDGTVLGMNANLLATLGYRLEEIMGRHHRTLMDPSEVDIPEYGLFWHTLRSGKFLSGRYKRIGRDGREIWLQASYNPIFDLNGKLDRIMKFAIDITADVAMAEAFEDAKRQAHHDPATSLPNRTRLASFLSTHLADAADTGSRLAVMYLDLDRFKAINDTHGHPVGDKVLGEVADRLRRSLKPDQIAARIGGDEFVIAAPHSSEEAVATHCQGLLEAIAQPIIHDSQELFVGLSIGVAMAPTDGTTPDELLRAADTALYRS
ncbi:PAS domain S-box protein, partial [Pseudomonas sp.]|uniref:PAS domain S-box protein n=1 Tax=Pseudomonas sp. TaxID=306 RepID=UPI0025D9A68B